MQTSTERNSEGRNTRLYAIAAIAMAVGAAADALLQSGVFAAWPTVVVIVGLFSAAAVVVAKYTRARTDIKIAAAKELAPGGATLDPSRESPPL